MLKPTAAQVAAAKAEMEMEDRLAEMARPKSEAERKSLPSEDPEHVCGWMCDGQDGLNSRCARLRRKLFPECQKPVGHGARYYPCDRPAGHDGECK